MIDCYLLISILMVNNLPSCSCPSFTTLTWVSQPCSKRTHVFQNSAAGAWFSPCQMCHVFLDKIRGLSFTSVVQFRWAKHCLNGKNFVLLGPWFQSLRTNQLTCRHGTSIAPGHIQAQPGDASPTLQTMKGAVVRCSASSIQPVWWQLWMVDEHC